MNTKTDRKTAFAIILLSLFAIGELIWVSLMLTQQLGRSREEDENQGQSRIEWKTYTNTECGLEFRYPDTWNVHELEQSGTEYSAYVSLGTYDKDWKENQGKTSLGVMKMIKKNDPRPDELSDMLFDGLEEIGIGQGENIKARKITDVTGDDEDIPLFSNKQIISYFIQQSGVGGAPRCEVSVAYLSDLEGKHLREFRHIMGTLKMF